MFDPDRSAPLGWSESAGLGPVRTPLADVLETAVDAVCAFDPQLRCTYANASFLRIVAPYGTTREDLLGRHVRETLPSSVSAQFHETVERASASGLPSEYRERVSQPTLWLEVRALPSAGGVVVWIRDVTDRERALELLREAQHEAEDRSQLLEQQAVELESQTEEAQSLTEELEQIAEELQAALAETEASRDRAEVAQELTARSEQRYRALVEANTLMVWRTNAAGLVEDMPFWRELTGQTEDEVRGNGWTNAIHPDDRERVAATWWAAHEARRLYECRYRLRMYDGTYRAFDARGVPVLNDDGSVREWVGSFNAVDLRPERGRRLLTLAAALSEAVTPGEVADAILREGVAATGADGASLALVHNDADGRPQQFHIVRTTGYPDRLVSEFTEFPVRAGRPLSDAVLARAPRLLASLKECAERYPAAVQDFQDTAYQGYAALPVVAGGVVIAGVSFSFREPQSFDEDMRTFLATIGELCAQALVRARTYAAEHAARAEAETANRTKADFLAKMSHELRTPLNAIAGYAQLMQLGIHGPLTDEQRSALERIQRSQHHLLGLINDILNYAKVEAGRVEYRLEAVDAGVALASLEPLIGVQLLQRGLVLVLPTPGDRVLVRADPEKLQQILLNLCTNAAKAMSSGGRLTLSVRTEGDWVCFDVADDGVGIPAGRLEEIFEPFVQLERGLTSQHEGAGLGLAISRDLARGMGGDLGVRSTLGSGSVFTVRLPAAGDDASMTGAG